MPDRAIGETWEVSDTCAGVRDQEPGRVQTLLLPAALGEVEIDGPADVLFDYLPDLTRDVIIPAERRRLLAGAHRDPGEDLEPPA